MLEAMFPGWSVETLFSPYTGENQQLAGPPESADAPATVEDQVNEMERRQLLQGLAALGAVAIPFSPKESQEQSAGTVTTAARSVDLSGEWWASWQTFRNGVEKIATQQVECKQSGELIQVATITHGLGPDDGGYHWNGALRLWDNEILMGWYSASEGSVRSKGTMYFTLHPHGLQMSGRWVGLGYDDQIMTGWGSMAKTRENAEAVIERLGRSQGSGQK